MGALSWDATNAEMAVWWGVRSMNQLDAFKTLPEKLSLDEKRELYRLFVANPEQGVLKVTELAANYGLSLSAAEVAELIADVDQDGHTRDVPWEEALPIPDRDKRFA